MLKLRSKWNLCPLIIIWIIYGTKYRLIIITKISFRNWVNINVKNNRSPKSSNFNKFGIK